MDRTDLMKRVQLPITNERNTACFFNKATHHTTESQQRIPDDVSDGLRHFHPHLNQKHNRNFCAQGGNEHFPSDYK
jgi:hypothetical protein